MPNYFIIGTYRYPHNNIVDKKLLRINEPISRCHFKICENIEYDILCQSYKPESVEELVELMLDAICTTKKYLQINGESIWRENNFL